MGYGSVSRARGRDHAEGASALTLVTGLFDLARREAGAGRRGLDFYLDQSAFLFGLDRDVLFFVDPELEDTIRSRRRALEHRTRVYPIALEHLPVMSILPEIWRSRSLNPIHNASPAKDTPLYTALGWSKVDLLDIAMKEDPFGASRFAWIDFGITHIARTDHCLEDGIFDLPGERARLLMMRNVTTEEVADRRSFYAWLRGHVAAGYLAGGCETLRRLGELFRAEAGAMLAIDIAPTEEQILAVLVAEHPELFDLYYGDYNHVLENCARTRGSAENLLFQMRVCRDQRDFARGCVIGERILTSHRDGFFHAPPEVLSALLDEYFTAAWYRDHPEQSAAREVARYYVELTEKDPEFRAAFLRDEEHIRSNFGFLAEPVLV